MIATLLLIILAAVTVGGVVAARKESVRRRGVLTAGVGGIAFLVVLALNVTTIVPTRDIGIVTTFGRPTGELPNGFHLIAPWQDVTAMDGAIQLQSFTGNSYDDHGDAIQVRLANNSNAYVNLNVQWRIDAKAAPQLFLDYRNFDNIRANLVDKQLQVAASHAFATFNPQTQTQGVDLPGMASVIKDQAQAAVGTRIEILQVFVPTLFYDKATQDRIDAFNQKAQETKNAEQDVKTAQQNRLAAEQRAAQQPPDLRIAIFNCINDQVKAGRDPAGCWGQIGGQPLLQVPVPGR
jgi:regulator of protease activity HflC (stomatin/prohibitin superfamily)